MSYLIIAVLLLVVIVLVSKCLKMKKRLSETRLNFEAMKRIVSEMEKDQKNTVDQTAQEEKTDQEKIEKMGQELPKTDMDHTIEEVECYIARQQEKIKAWGVKPQEAM